MRLLGVDYILLVLIEYAVDRISHHRWKFTRISCLNQCHQEHLPSIHQKLPYNYKIDPGQRSDGFDLRILNSLSAFP
jgi:hypothetical protein